MIISFADLSCVALIVWLIMATATIGKCCFSLSIAAMTYWAVIVVIFLNSHLCTKVENYLQCLCSRI